ncbi:hypothetical protein [Desmospora activa]|uniref:Uncharacterized protein n=1 Tax=Desmospora activa DSM 45169 TaxID=1121389 RepID=A0A2T4Z4V6_9BACL|nr:hypothetical protein [Desmospora activa]PTM56931.1 hypothetical protein C8J48_3260 [Desmospora activa DSM 45169]
MGVTIRSLDVDRCSQHANVTFGDNAISSRNQLKRNDCVVIFAGGSIHAPTDTSINMDPDDFDQYADNRQNTIFP